MRQRPDQPHDAATTWLTDHLDGPVRVGLPWQSLTAFLRISTHPRVFAEPLDPGRAWRQVQERFDAPAAWVPVPTPAHADVLSRLVRDHHCSGDLVSNAHLAALAIEHGLAVVSADTAPASQPSRPGSTPWPSDRVDRLWPGPAGPGVPAVPPSRWSPATAPRGRTMVSLLSVY